jgi:hypothetical protein
MAQPVRTFLHRISLTRNGTQWWQLEEEQVGHGFEVYGRAVATVAGTYRNLRTVGAIAASATRTTKLRHSSNPGTRVGGGAPSITMADTALSCAYSNPTTSAQNTSDTVHVDAGDIIAWQSANAPPTGGSDIIQVSYDFEPDVQDEAPYSWGNTTHGSGTRRVPMFTGAVSSLFGTGVVDIIAVPCELTRYDPIGFNTPGGGNGFLFTVEVNGVAQDGTGGTVDTRCQFTGSNFTTTWTGSLQLNRGDIVDLLITDIGTPTTMAIGCSSCLKSDLPGLYNKFISRITALGNTVALYRGYESGIGFETTEADVKTLGGLTNIRLSGMIARLGTGNIGSAPASITIDARLNEGAVVGGPQIVATGNVASGIFEDTNDGEMTITGSDYFSVRHLPSASPNSPNVANPLALAFRGGTPIVPVLLSVTKHVREIFVDEDEDLDEIAECSGGGEVAQAENPAEGVSLATTSAPLHWLEVTLNDGSPATVYRWAGMSIAHGEPKEARVLQFGTLTRALSDIDGGFESATITTELQDIDGTIRSAWLTGTLRGARVDYFCADFATVKTGGTPDRRFRGYISKCEPAGDRRFRLTVEDALTNRLNAIDGQDLQVPTQIIEDRLADLRPDAQAFDLAAPLLFGSISDEFGAWECPWVGTAEEDGELLEWFLVSMGVVIVNEVFLAGLGATADVRVQVPPDAFELGRPYVPGKPGWIEANDWSVRDGRRWTLVAGRADDPAIILAKEGTIPLVTNVCGLQADQSLSSSPNGTVNSPPRALLLLMNNYLAQDAPGDFLPILTDGDVPLVDTPSAEAVHDALAAMADSSFDPSVAGAVGGDFRQSSWRDRVAEFLRSHGFDLGINHHGQAFFSVMDTTVGSTAFSFTPDTILAGSVQFPTRLPVENEVRFVHTPNYLTPLGLLTPEPESRLPRDTVSADWLSGLQVVRDEASITALGGSPRGRRRSAIQEYTLSRNGAQSAAVAQRRLDLLSPPNGRIEVSFALSIKHGCDVELGQLVDVEHWDLPWAGSRKCRVMRIEEDMDGLTLQITVRDVDDLVA